MSKLPRMIAMLMAMLLTFSSIAPSVGAQDAELPATSLPELVATFDGSPGFVVQEQRLDGYLFQAGAPGDALANANPIVAETFTNAGVIDAYGRSTVFKEEQPQSTLYPDVLGEVQLQVRVLTFGSEDQAEAFVNTHPQLTRDEFVAAGDPSTVVDLVKLPYTPQAASGWRTEVVGTSDAGVEYSRSNVNYTGQFGRTVVIGRAFATSDLAEPMAREVFLLQMVCVQLDTPCDVVPVPVEFPLSAQSAAEFPEGKISTSVTAEAPAEAPSEAAAEGTPAEEIAPTAEPETQAPALPGHTSASLPVSGAAVVTAGDWLVSDPIVGDNGEALVLSGGNANAIVAVVSGSDANAVQTAVTMAIPTIGEMTPVEIAASHTLHSVSVNNVTYGVFSTWSANDTGQVFVVSYIAPVSTFADGLTVAQRDVAINNRGMFPGADASAIQQFFVAAVGQGDAAVEAALTPLVSLTP